jgi:hypothetical protein
MERKKRRKARVGRKESRSKDGRRRIRRGEDEECIMRERKGSE